ncbi:MAG: hypothetical protein KGQ49_03620 [Verrucomicrobia bacterium]|nr:hypothetical protein [Verrucomicrobiota bacterium]MBU6446471.1 hypothetical protein [Verrucomicrobiota bacterium]MDE3047602.1 hypothetical protein [Verrucomicrobiota bacterium]
MVKKLFRYQLPKREGLILQWDDLFGEIAPLPGFSKETLQEAEKEVTEWILNGASPSLPSVRFGIASAQRPLQSVRLRLCSLGPKPGFPAWKLKLGHLPLQEAIRFAKEHKGPHVRLDCNRAWSLDEALEFASHFQPGDFDYLEEPVKTVPELREFSRITRFPIALDESIDTDWSQIPSLKTIVVKPTIVGGAPKTHLNLVLSSAYESGLGLLHIANLARNRLPIGLDTVFEEDLLAHPIQSSAGVFAWNKEEPLLNMDRLCRVL